MITGERLAYEVWGRILFDFTRFAAFPEMNAKAREALHARYTDWWGIK